MENGSAIAALAALAQSTRLDSFRLLVRHEPDGLPAGEIARLVGVSPTSVMAWRQRYQSGGIAGLNGLDRPGRPWTLDHRAIVAGTPTGPMRQPTRYPGHDRDGRLNERGSKVGIQSG